MQILCPSPQDLAEVAQKIIAFAQPCRVWTFRGQLGAGKTTLIKAICRELGVDDSMSSPSFSLVNEYQSPRNESIYHLDLYRLKSEQEAADIGVEDYIFSNKYCFIEWPEVAFGLLDSFLDISISIANNQARTIELNFYERR